MASVFLFKMIYSPITHPLSLIVDGNLADHWKTCPKLSSVKNKVRVVNYKREHKITQGLKCHFESTQSC